MSETSAAPTSQRIDRWLWCARFFKTRTLAAKFVQDGHVRITRNDQTIRVEKPSTTVRERDVLVFTRADQLRIIEILKCADRRGPASEAQALYADQSPPHQPKAERIVPPFVRDKGAGRPTKKDRRELDAIKPN
ncbi:MAG: RNA-binding protein S4 [Hyphococcus sp.]|nr:MAG: RNA-binding protein S4 [Marinicaulis sp.]